MDFLESVSLVRLVHQDQAGHQDILGPAVRLVTQHSLVLAVHLAIQHILEPVVRLAIQLIVEPLEYLVILGLVDPLGTRPTQEPVVRLDTVVQVVRLVTLHFLVLAGHLDIQGSVDGLGSVRRLELRSRCSHWRQRLL